MNTPGFIPAFGGYKKLLSYQKARVVYKGTVYFIKRWVPRISRTTDQMEQAARSGKQNIVEGSLASAVSKETEIKLTGVALASLGELLAGLTRVTIRLLNGQLDRLERDFVTAGGLRERMTHARLAFRRGAGEIEQQRAVCHVP